MLALMGRPERKTEGFTVVVTGGRNYDNEAFVHLVLDRVHKSTPIKALAHGACRWDLAHPDLWFEETIEGADGHADTWAMKHEEVALYRYPADWSLGAKGGPIRNAAMLDAMKPDLLLAFPGDRGTWNCIKEAIKRGIYIEPAAYDPKDSVEYFKAIMRLRQDMQRPSEARSGK